MYIRLSRVETYFSTFVIMKNVDYIVVGLGLASIAFCEQLRLHQKSFVVFDDSSQQSSRVAAGLYNPVILKRFTSVWKAAEQLSIALPMYAKIEEELNIKVDYKLRILRRFASVEEQNMWFSATDKPLLEPYLSTALIKNTNPLVDAPYDFGEVLHTGWVDTVTLLDSSKNALTNQNKFVEEQFDYSAIKFQNKKTVYKDYSVKNIVFAEGFGMKQNPFFKHVPLNGTKGEVLTINAPNLNLNYAIKSSVFIIPKGNDIYTVGSTYKWKDKTNAPTDSAKEELITKLESFITCDFEVINHLAGIRPTVQDRRPLVGQHSVYKNLYLLNGLGSRGVMIAPYVAEKLYHYIEENIPLDREININRFF